MVRTLTDMITPIRTMGVESTSAAVTAAIGTGAAAAGITANRFAPQPLCTATRADLAAVPTPPAWHTVAP